MMHHRLLSVVAVLGLAGAGWAQDAKKTDPAPKKDPAPKVDDKKEPKKEQPTEIKLPLTKLSPAKLIPNLCVLKYRVTTTSPECQAFVDQGLGYFYSYVWMEAGRSFEAALRADPNCAMAWWGLSRSIEKWGKGQHNDALKKAQELLPRASHRESFLIKARLQEKGLWPNTPPEKRKAEASKTIDELLSLYDDDEEGWFYRAQLADSATASISMYKALLRINPQHPGAHHELVHLYENTRRPALGWQHAEGYIQSSPGLPHAFHMQAHLGTRIGKWGKTTDWSAHAIELQVAYHKQMGVKPAEDWQFAHHLETLMLSLIHDGRFEEAKKIKKQCEGWKIEHPGPWFRLHLAERDFKEALAVADKHAKRDKVKAAYWRALVFLKKGDLDRATAEVNVLQEAYQSKRNNKDLEIQLWETQGLLQCLKGPGEGGVKLLQRCVDKTKDQYQHHAWGHGAYFMEIWGLGALRAGRLEAAEEAFLEALAHDAGSARGALGMMVVCERLGRTEESLRYAELAQRCWRRADAGLLQIESADMRGEKTPETNEGAGQR